MSKVVVIGGHSRNIGKTSLMANIIRHTSHLNWTALKITQYGHGVCSINGKSCHCSDEEHTFAIQEEREASSRNDSSRFLQAGARKSFWVRTKQGMLFEALPEIRRIIAGASFAILESNSILRFMKPDLYVVVLDPANMDFKASAKQFLDRADAFACIERESKFQWTGISERLIAQKPVFPVREGEYFSTQIGDFIQEKLLHGVLSGSQESSSRGNNNSQN